ncbi:MAG: serine hydrolase [Acidobacteriota bacterium]
MTSFELTQVSRRWRAAIAVGFISVSLMPRLAVADIAPAVAPARSPTDRVAERFLQTRGHVAIASFTADASGAPLASDPSVLLNLERRMPLGSSIKIPAVIAYAVAVERGEIDPNETITTETWEQLYMPDADGGSHARALAELGLASDDYGFALDRSATVSIQRLMELMIHHSDNAAYDYIVRRLGEAQLASILAECALTSIDVPSSDVGEVLTRSNHEIGTLTAVRIARFKVMSRQELQAEFNGWREKFLDPQWKAEEFAWRLAGGADEPYARQAAALAITDPKGAAGEFARLMIEISQGRLISMAVSDRVAAILEWPLAWIPGATDAFERWGAKGGSIPGVLTDNNFTIAKVGDFAGSLRVTVVFVDGLGASAWRKLLDSNLFLFEQRLMSDAAFVASLQKRLERGNR